MRVSYPINDSPLFSYPAISIQKYDWSKRTAVQKSITYLAQGIYCIVLIVFLVAGVMHIYHFSWGVLWQLIKGLYILALFPLFVWPLIFWIEKAFSRVGKHLFYRDWAKVYTGFGEGQYTRFFSKDIESISMHEAHFEGLTFYLVKVDFKPWFSGFLGRRGSERFGIQVEDQSHLSSLRDWAQLHGIEISFDRTDPSTGSE